MFSIKRVATAVAIGVITGTVGLASPVDAHTTGIHDNCTNLHKKWPHGVGRQHARDKTSGKPVKNSHHNTKQYKLAEGHNGTLDADNDGIACESR